MTNPAAPFAPCIVTELQLREIDQSIAEADAGEFATDEEVEAAFEYLRTGVDHLPMPKEKS